VIGASLVVHLLFARATAGGADVLATMWRVVTRDYFLDTSQVQVDAAMRLVESLLLLRAAWSTAAADRIFGLHALRAFVLGAAAAGAVNVGYLWTAALRRESPLRTFLSYVATIRFNRQYPDVNAAGSYFVMALFAAVGMLVTAPRLLPAVATILIALSLTFSGSRAAVVAGVVCALPLGVRWVQRITPVSRSHRWGIAVALTLFVCMSSAGIYALLKRNPISSIGALEIRREFAATSWRMVKPQPFFGVGIGEFWVRSGQYSSVELLTRYPQAQHENAHNNFLQLLTELGLIGFAAVMMVLGIAANACAHQLRSHPDDWRRWMLAAGLLAFVVTWLAGHPLLLDAPAFSFWLLLGIAAGWGKEPPIPQASRLTIHYVPLVLALLTVSSVPLRVRSEIAGANLEHQGIGLSGWQYGDDGIMYRIAGADSTVFLPSSARVVTVPLRAHDPQQELEVELRLENRTADVVRVTGHRWYMLQLPMPGSADAPRFRRLDLLVRSAPAEEALLRVGKATPR
jgi:O-antigen ligase